MKKIFTLSIMTLLIVAVGVGCCACRKGKNNKSLTGQKWHMVKMMEQHAENGLNYSGKCYISQSARMEEALAMKEMIEAKFPNISAIEIDNIGTVIGSHTGPGTFVVFFWGDARVN